MNTLISSPKPKSVKMKGDSVTLQTVIGQQIWRGRAAGDGKTFILGADGFLKRVRNMEQAMDDDPWAAQTQAEILRALDACQAEYDEMQNEIDAAFPEQTSAISYEMPELAGILQPEHFAIKQRRVVGWRFIDLLVQADELILDLLTAERLGLKTAKKRGQQTAQVQRKARSVMSLIAQWKYTGVTHQDVLEDNGMAQNAIALFGPLKVQIEQFDCDPGAASPGVLVLAQANSPTVRDKLSSLFSKFR